MRPEFAAAVDPVFSETLRFRECIDRGGDYITADARAKILRAIDNAEGKINDPNEWRFTKLALCAWIDALLIESGWSDGARDWWKNNSLEKKYFGKRVAHDEFFQWAIDAGGLRSKDALEVYYLAVVLGFRGFYADPSKRAERIKGLRLPESLQGWCHSTARSLQLRQGRPDPPEVIEARNSARPLKGRQTLAMYSIIGTVLAAFAVGTAVYVFQLYDFKI